MLLMLMAFLPVIFFMFFSQRSTQKKQKEMESKLKKGDRIVTQAGLVGKLVDPVEGRHAKIEIAPRSQCDDLKPVRKGLNHAESAAADASGRSQNSDTLHG